MEDTATHEAIHVRGRIYSESPIYAKCKNAPAKKVFRTLLEMAEEASTVRAAVANSTASHPLEGKLLSMSTAQVVTYLMGLTEKFIQGNEQIQLSDKLQSPSEPRAASQASTKITSRVIEETTPNGEAGKVVDALEMDEDLMDSFASFPTQS